MTFENTSKLWVSELERFLLDIIFSMLLLLTDFQCHDTEITYTKLDEL